MEASPLQLGTWPQKPKRTFSDTTSCQANSRPRGCWPPPARCTDRSRLPPPPGTDGPAVRFHRCAGRWFPKPTGARTPITGSHGVPAAPPQLARPRAVPWPRPPILLHSGGCPMPPPPAARLAGGRSAGTFPRPAARVAHQRRSGRGPGERSGQWGRAELDRGSRLANVPSPPPSLSLPLPSPPPRQPAGARRSRRTAAGPKLAQGAGLGLAWALGLAFAPPLSGCQSAERGTGLVEGKLLPRSPCPFPPPPALSLPRALGRGTAWERDGGVLTGGRA